MLAKESSLPIPDLKATSSKDLFKYFVEILPEYDTERVLISDVKKVLKWYSFLRKRELFPFEVSEDIGGEEE